MKHVKTSDAAQRKMDEIISRNDWKWGDYLVCVMFAALYLLVTTNAGWRMIGNVISFVF